MCEPRKFRPRYHLCDHCKRPIKNEAEGCTIYDSDGKIQSFMCKECTDKHERQLEMLYQGIYQ